MHFLLMYDFGPDYLERRPAFRTEHLALAWKSHAGSVARWPIPSTAPFSCSKGNPLRSLNNLHRRTRTFATGS